MGRGKSLKRIKQEELAKEKARLEAEFKEKYKVFTDSKRFLVWFRDFLKESGVTDTLKLIAILTLTGFIKGTIDKAQEVREQLAQQIMRYPLIHLPLIGLLMSAFGRGGSLVTWNPEDTLPAVPVWLNGWYPVLPTDPEYPHVVTPPETKEEAMASWQMELAEWLLAFVLAYIIVEHGGEIIGLLGDVAKISGIALALLI